jgi:dTDP-4-dehydrorhamnose 3,5-epimerase
MDKLQRSGTALSGVSLLEPRVFRDDRGFFFESYNQQDYARLGIDTLFVQDNHSCSAKGVIRGLHFQARYPQEKLVRVIRGAIFDVAVDIRKGSPAYGHSVGIVLSASGRMIHIPAGFAHGFLALEDHTEVLYKASDLYHPEHDAGIVWNDPDLKIAWPFAEYNIRDPIISGKDRQLPRLSRIDSPFVYEAGAG